MSSWFGTEIAAWKQTKKPLCDIAIRTDMEGKEQRHEVAAGALSSGVGFLVECTVVLP